MVSEAPRAKYRVGRIAAKKRYRIGYLRARVTWASGSG